MERVKTVCFGIVLKELPPVFNFMPRARYWNPLAFRKKKEIGENEKKKQKLARYEKRRKKPTMGEDTTIKTDFWEESPYSFEIPTELLQYQPSSLQIH